MASKNVSECPMCFEEMHSLPICMYLAEDGRSCRHYLHLACAERCKKDSMLCPYCRQPFYAIALLPDPFESKRAAEEWFRLVDVEGTGSVSKQNAIDVIKAMLGHDEAVIEPHWQKLVKRLGLGGGGEVPREALPALLQFLRDIEKPCVELSDGVAWEYYFHGGRSWRGFSEADAEILEGANRRGDTMLRTREVGRSTFNKRGLEYAYDLRKDGSWTQTNVRTEACRRIRRREAEHVSWVCLGDDASLHRLDAGCAEVCEKGFVRGEGCVQHEQYDYDLHRWIETDRWTGTSREVRRLMGSGSPEDAAAAVQAGRVKWEAGFPTGREISTGREIFAWKGYEMGDGVLLEQAFATGRRTWNTSAIGARCFNKDGLEYLYDFANFTQTNMGTKTWPKYHRPIRRVMCSSGLVSAP
eukprot:Hpha_TRINITY_DN16093_c2_g1::TRINITY_DN16093_c2_g1_i2::g.116988::m.116988